MGFLLAILGPRPIAAQETTTDLQTAVIRAIVSAERSVVAIAVIPKNIVSTRLDLLDLQRQFLAPDRLPLERLDPTNPDYLPGRFASGVLIDATGHIVTTYHALGDPRRHDYVIWHAGEAQKAVRLQAPPRVLAGDPWTDLALLQTQPIGQPIRLADGAKLARGTFVVALGNPYALARDGRPSAAWGIVANLRRSAPPRASTSGVPPKQTLHHYGTLLQVDFKLPIGSSGGALINLHGELVGLTTSLAPLAGYETTAGFAIPVDTTFRQTLEQLKQGRIPAFGFLGVQPEDLTPAERRLVGGGARVVRVVAGTAAARARLAVGDIITHVNHHPVTTKDDLIRQISSLPHDAHVSLAIHRLAADGSSRQRRTVDVQLDKKPLETWLTAYESAPVRTWRGIRVEEATAIPLTLRRQSGAVPDPQGCVGILHVAPNSPAWRVGLRPGAFITHVEGQRVANTTEFYKLVDEQTDAVTLKVLDGSSGARNIVVPPP